MYQIRILDRAGKELGRLDKPVGRRIVKRMAWLAEHFDEIEPQGLTGDLAGLTSFESVTTESSTSFSPKKP